jgi:hypothetical protein
MSNRNVKTKHLVLGIFVCLITMGIYNFLFFNRYLPVCYDWFSVYAHYINNGQLPYRDFYFFLPPLYLYIITAFCHVFGESLFLLGIFGSVVILAMTVLLFLLLSKLFPVYIACFAAIVSMIFYQSEITFTASNFMSFLGLFALAGTLLICQYFSSSGKGWRIIYLFLAGLFGVFTFLTKQSDGLYILAFSFLAVVIVSYAKQGFRKGIRSVAIYLAGILIPLLYIFVWLDISGILKLFWTQVFNGASSSKGGILTMLFAWIPHLMTMNNLVSLILVAFIIYNLRILFSPQGFQLERFRDGTRINSKSNIILLLVILVVGLLCILVPYWNVGFSYSLNDSHLLNFTRYILLIIDVFVGLLILFCIYLVKMFNDRDYFNIFVIITISLGIMLGNTPSAGLGDLGTLMGLGLLIGFLASIPSSFKATQIIVLIACVFFSMYLVSSKYIQPYNWWGLTQPDVRTTSISLNSKYLSGLVVSEQTAQIFNEVPAIIDKYTTPNEKIYTFPSVPLFYLLADRPPSSPDIGSWFDLLPDKPAEADAVRLIESPPSAIIYLDVPEFVWQGHETAFRGGQPSGQRQIVSAIEKLISGGEYELKSSYYVPVGYVLEVWVQK